MIMPAAVKYRLSFVNAETAVGRPFTPVQRTALAVRATLAVATARVLSVLPPSKLAVPAELA